MNKITSFQNDNTFCIYFRTMRLALLLCNQVRVRFAPSPTGQLHIGGFRSALYNYLFAKNVGGKFLLRIEDTDQTRVVPGAAKSLEKMLNWAGLVPDESPSVGGDFGPYVQSQRLEMYQESVNLLIENGKAYRCFCSEKRLAILKKEAAKARTVNRYDGRCKELSDQEIEDNLGQNKKFTVRLNVDNCENFTSFDDLVFGPCKHGSLVAEGDPIILKSDGFPVYHLANVVDDHHMKISHVFRGVEWQVSTPKHLMLYAAFGWKPPQFGHLPLVMNADGTKLSKRQGDVHLEEYMANGYYPDAISNFITLSGGGFHDRDVIHEGSSKVYPLSDLCQKFDYKLLKTNNTKLDFEKLNLLNQKVLQEMIEDPIGLEKLVQDVRLYLKTDDSNQKLEDDHVLAGYLKWLANRVHRLSDLKSPNYAFLWSAPKSVNYSGPITSEILKEVSLVISESNGTAANVSQKLRTLADERNINFRELMKCLRSVLSGLKQGPPVGEMVEHLGMPTTLKRLKSAVKLFNEK